MAKKIDAGSVRQLVFEKIVQAGDDGIKASDIVKQISTEFGIDKKKIPVHSHLQAFKNMQAEIVIHDMETAKYFITEVGRQKYETDREPTEAVLTEA